MKNPFSFPSATIQAALADIRNVVWSDQEFNINSFATRPAFFKEFKDWRQMFIHAPRVNFKGVYYMKERYLKTGQKISSQSYDPVYVVEFFRYIRFFPDGTCLSGLSLKKIKEIEIANTFRWNNNYIINEVDEENDQVYPNHHIHAVPQEEEEEKMDFVPIAHNKNFAANHNCNIMRGEYITKEDQVYIRSVKGFSIYETDLKLRSTEPGKNDLLIIKSRFARNVGSRHRDNVNIDHLDSVKFFKYKRIKGFEYDIRKFMKTASAL